MRKSGFFLPALRRVHLLREAFTAYLFAYLVLPTQAITPSWWESRGVIVTNKAADDYAAINQGQLKKLAASAVNEMNLRLNGGAGTALNSMVNAWDNATGADDYAVVTNGQLKHLAKPIYQRLIAAGVISTLPDWINATGPSNEDFALSNIGQAKRLFAFHLPNQTGGRFDPPNGWLGSKWTQNREPIEPVIVTHEPLVNGLPKDFFLKEYTLPEGQSLSTQLKMRRADLWGLSGLTYEGELKHRYRRLGKKNPDPDPNNTLRPEAPGDAPGYWWWQGVPPGILSSNGLSDDFSYWLESFAPFPPGYLPDSNVNCVAFKKRTSNFQYSGSDGNVFITGQLREDIWTEVRLELSVPNTLADRQIIKEYWLSDNYGPTGRRYRFVINPGTSRSSQQINFSTSNNGSLFLFDAPPLQPKNISPSDVTGPHYRKVGLNGVPQPDNPPQNQEENDIPADETYVDAYNRTLRHSVTDIWSKVGSTELPLAVRRTSSPETWSWNSSLRPVERTDRPFGMGFTSNLTPQISFQEYRGPGSADKYPIRAIVTDEHGATRSFVRVGTDNQHAWVPDLEQKQDAKTCFDRLVQLPGTPVRWELRKKFGTTCQYQMMFLGDERISQTAFGGGVIQEHPTDREKGSDTTICYSYGRMTKVTDKLGNELHYTYPDQEQTTPPLLPSFIPSKIHDPARPTQVIYIAQQKGLIQTIRGPSGEMVHYFYSTTTVNEGGENHQIHVLNRVVRGENENHEKAAEVKYLQLYTGETELDPDPTDPQANRYGHIDIQRITDERDNTHYFYYADYADAAETTVEYSNGYYSYAKRQSGGPRMIAGILRPNGQTVTFTGNRNMHYALSGKVVTPNNPSGLTTSVSSPSTGTYTYAFSQPHIFKPPLLSETSSQNIVVAFSKMTIVSPAGAETYEFDPQAGMALKRATDVSGNVTRYTYEDLVPGTSAARQIYGLLKYDDPSSEVSAIHTADFNGTKRYEYEPNFRLLKKVTDEKGTATEYAIDTIGRRTQEKITDVTGTVLKVTDFTYDQPDPMNPGKTVFQGFMTSQIIRTTGLQPAPAGIPAPIGELRTDFVPDDDGRIKDQKVYIDAGAAQPLITSYTYTGNGSKRTVTDPRNNTTTFEYEPHTLRLKKVIYPNSTFKEMYYDDHGNLTKEINEVGAKTFHDYDELNRRIKSTIDLNANGNPGPAYTKALTPGTATAPPDYGGDLVTHTTYNDFNLPVDETNTLGKITHHDYDTAGRRKRTTVNDDGNPASVSSMEFVTEYVDAVSGTPDWVGGSMFDVSGFKPLRVKDPRGFVTEFEYDKLYRPTRTTLRDTSYTSAQEVVTFTEYDEVGNTIKITDSLENVTSTDYDGLKRPVKTVLPISAGGEDINVPKGEKSTAYTPSGQVWSSTDELGNTTYNIYDHAGRLTTTLMPAVEVPGMEGQSLRPQVWQSYDEAGNVMEKSDALGNITLTEYDTRNRPVKVIMPEVLDAETGLASHPEILTGYDNVGQVISVTDPLLRTTHSAYDLAGRCFRIVAPPTGSQTHVTLTEHDPAGNALTVTDAKGQTVTNTYDAINRLETTTDHEGILNSFEYDKAGNRTLVTDGLGRETRFVYDAQKRLTEQEFANGDTWTHSYNAINKIGQKDAKGVTTTYTYDVRNRLRKVSAPDLERRQAYDDAGRLRSVTETGRPQATVSYTYDALARVISETSQEVTHSYGYDLTGNRIQATYGTGRTVDTTYDALNRPATITESGHTTTYGYDRAGRALKLTAGNGQVTQNVYDEIGRLTHRTLYASAADLTATGVLAQFGWGHDAVGNVTAHSEEWKANASRPAGTRTTGMTYDGVSRLLTETISDPVTGITMTTYTYDKANNRKSKTVAGGSEPGYWHYDYNRANQLVSWTKHDEPDGTLLKSAGLEYDLNGNRTGLEVIGQSGTSPNASLIDQGITYTSVASGPAGDSVSVSLRGEQANESLGVHVESSNHVVVNLATGPASHDTLVDQGITYTTNAVHQAGEEVSVRLVADEPGQTEEEVQVIGKDITVKLATGTGAPASATRQGITYQAFNAGLEGNDLKVHLKKASLGQPASVSRAGSDVTVKLATNAGTPDTFTDQGITYTTVLPHETGKDVSLTLIADETNQTPGVEVNGNDIKVFLETDEGAPAHKESQDISYEAVVPGSAGNGLSVYMADAEETDPLSVDFSTIALGQLIVRIPYYPGVRSSLTLPGIMYQGKVPGPEYDVLNVQQVDAGPGQELAVSVDGNDVTVLLGTSPGDHARLTRYAEGGSSITFTAVEPGLQGNQIYIDMRVRYDPNLPLEVYTNDNVVYVLAATDGDGNLTTTLSDIATAVQSAAGHLVTVQVSYDSNASLAMHSFYLSGGGDNYTVTSNASDISGLFSVTPGTANLFFIAGDYVPLEAGGGQLTGGKTPAYRRLRTQQEILGDDGVDDDEENNEVKDGWAIDDPRLSITSNNVADVLMETPGVSDLILVNGGSDTPFQPINVQLSDGGSNPKVKTTVSQLVTLLNSNQTLLTATATDSGSAEATPLSRRVLGDGWEPAVLTTTAEVVTLLAEDPQINDVITVSGGSPTAVAQVGSLELRGGGLGFELASYPSAVIAAINNHSVASTLITASGYDATILSPLPRTVLRGGEPAILSTASDVAALLSGHSLVTATGSGSAILSPLDRTFLSSTISRTSYTWNSQDRLTGVKTPDGTRHGYTYDYRARRVQTSRSNGPQPAQTTAVVFSGGLSLAEYESSTPGAITANAPTVHYLRGPDMGGGVGGMLYSIRGTTLKYSLSNGRGDIVAQSDEDAVITWTASYEAFGKRPAETGTNLDKQRANSKDEDPTGLLNEGFRYRDLETGAFISRDPAGFVDGPNLYAYVLQNPWTGFDPLGLWDAVPVPVNAPFMEKMALTWENAKRGFSSLPGELASGFKNVMSNKAAAATFAVSNAPLVAVAAYQTGMAMLTKPALAYGTVEAVSTGVEMATGYEGPSLPGPGDLVKAVAKNVGPETAQNIVKKTEEVIENTLENLKYHYTRADDTSFKNGLWRDTSVTDKLYDNAVQAGQELGIPTPTKVIPIQDKGQFVPNSPPIVQPSNRYQGGGTDFVNPEKVPASDLLPSKPIGEK